MLVFSMIYNFKKNKLNFHACRPTVKHFKLCFTCPLWFNSRVLHKFSVTVGGMVVILHGED